MKFESTIKFVLFLFIMSSQAFVTLQSAHSDFSSEREVTEQSLLTIDFTRVVNLQEDLQLPLFTFLSEHLTELPDDIYDYTVTVANEQMDKSMYIVLMPTDLYENYWEIPMLDDEIIRLEARKGTDGRWVWDFSYAPDQKVLSLLDYRFPWTGGDTWLKTQGFHYNTLGYSLDFIPNGNLPKVRAIETGILTPICDDGYQAMLKVDHGAVDSGYLHLDSTTIPTDSYNQNIMRGTYLGDLFNDWVIFNPHPDCTDIGNYQFATPCGCGYGMHLHFEVSSQIEIQGYTLQSISDSPYGTPYTSTNSSGNCCGCELLRANSSLSHESAEVTNFLFPLTQGTLLTPLHVGSPTGLTSSTHEIGEWTSNTEISVNWNIPDDRTFLAGYILNWNHSANNEFDQGMRQLSASTTSTTIPLPDSGVWYVHLQAIDMAGKLTQAVHFGPILIDMMLPILDDASTKTFWAKEPIPPAFYWYGANDEGSGVVGYQVYWGESEDGIDNDLVQDATFTPIEVIQDDKETTRYLRVAPIDAARNIGKWQTVAVWHYDPTPPTGALLLNGGSLIVNSLNVILNPVAEDTGSGVTDIRFSRDGQNWSEWESYSKQHNWKLENTVMPQIVYAQLRDAVGNVSEPMTAHVKVELDLVPPSSANYTVSCSVVGMGGGSKSSSNYTVHGTIGQPHAINDLQSSSYQVHSGFWSGCSELLVISPTPTPTIGVTPSPTNTPLVTPTLTVTPIATPDYYIFLPTVVKSGTLP